MITIVDYGMGNLGSIQNMFRRIGAQSQVSSSVEEIRKAPKLVLPGVGAFDAGMISLNRSGLREILDERVLADRTPILGLCLGMQLLGKGSEEGSLPGLGWIDSVTVRLNRDGATGLKVPHMGWNTVRPVARAALFTGFQEPPRFYFVHSYHVVCNDPADVSATVTHGTELTAAVARGSVMGVQFHPEKSHTYGMTLLKTFADFSDRTRC